MTARRFDGQHVSEFATVRVERFFSAAIIETDDDWRMMLPLEDALGIGEALLAVCGAKNGTSHLVTPVPGEESIRVERFFDLVVIETEDTSTRLLLPLKMAAALADALLDVCVCENGAAHLVTPGPNGTAKV